MLVFAAAGLFFLSLWLRPEIPRARAGINDFMGIYGGARLVGTPKQFDAGAYISEQLRATGWSAPAILYTRLPAFAFLLRPLGQLSYERAYLTWQLASFAAFLAFLILWPTHDRRLLLGAACWSFPLAADFIGGQDIAFLLLILAISWRLAALPAQNSSNPVRQLSAGGVLALCALKFHLFLLLPVFLIAQRRWRMLAGVAAGLVLVGIACYAVAGPGWIGEYTHFILQGRTNPNVRAMVNLHGLFEGLPNSVALELAGDLLAAVAVWWVARRADFPVGLSIALVGSLLTSHHSYPADVLLLLPALLTLAERAQNLALRTLCYLMLSPLPFLFTSQVPLLSPVPVLLVMTMFVACSSASHGVFEPPLLTAATTICGSPLSDLTWQR
jgi:hypothetical protein